MNDILQKQCDYVGKQVRAAVDGLSQEGWNTRPTETAMTPREIVTHLCGVYEYATAKARGEQATWTEYACAGDTNELMADFDSKRQEAITACLASEDPYEMLTDYIIVHDAYHVGQLCTARFVVQPDWDPYAIYS
jgi:uncharacterized damage-inducible protein DinB